MTHRPYRTTRRDANQGEIVRALRELGYFVEDISDGVHWADILVWGYDHNLGRRVWRAFEIKTATGKLTEGEKAMMDEWPGSVQVVRSVVDVLAAFGRC